jgi:hypothetical protein
MFRQNAADQYRPLATIPRAAGARTSVFVAANRSLYLAVPHRGSQNAEVWVYSVSESKVEQ